MRKIEQLAVVIELACLTEDRSKKEQKALLDVARRVDRERNRLTLTNPRVEYGVLREHSNLVGWVESTWDRPLGFVPCPGSGYMVEEAPRVRCGSCGVECATEGPVLGGRVRVMDHSAGGS